MGKKNGKAQGETQQFMVPQQRVKWVMHELAQAGVDPQMERGRDGFVTFTVGAKGASVIQGVMDHQRKKRKFGTHPAHKAANTVAASIATVAAVGGIYQAIIAGSFAMAGATAAMVMFIWWARSILNSDESAARLFQPIKPPRRRRSTQRGKRKRRRPRR